MLVKKPIKKKVIDLEKDMIEGKELYLTDPISEESFSAVVASGIFLRSQGTAAYVGAYIKSGDYPKPVPTYFFKFYEDGIIENFIDYYVVEKETLDKRTSEET